MSVLLQISDPHFGTEQPAVMETLVALAHTLRPDLVVLSGDLTQRATAKQFADARAFVERLGAPWVAIPGNHDIPLFDLASRVLRPYARYRNAFGEDLEPTYESADLLVLCVNTTRAHRHKHGEVSVKQIEQVAARLREATPAMLRVVVVHQPVAVPDKSEADNLLRGRDAAVDRWAQAGADVVLAGHIHWPHVEALNRLGWPLWAVNAGTALSTRLRPGIPNSVNVVRWGRDAPAGRCLVERWDHAAGRSAFIRQDLIELTPQRVVLA